MLLHVTDPVVAGEIAIDVFGAAIVIVVPFLHPFNVEVTPKLYVPPALIKGDAVEPPETTPGPDQV